MHNRTYSEPPYKPGDTIWGFSAGYSVWIESATVEKCGLKKVRVVEPHCRFCYHKRITDLKWVYPSYQEALTDLVNALERKTIHAKAEYEKASSEWLQYINLLAAGRLRNDA